MRGNCSILVRHRRRFRDKSEEDRMSTTSPYQQYFEGPAIRGIRSIRAGREAAVGLALIYAAIGASLGIVSGTAVAIQVFPASGTAAMSDLAQASASVAGLTSPLKAVVGQIPMVQSQPVVQAAAMPATPHAVVAVETSGGKTALASHPKMSTHKLNVSSDLEAISQAPTTSRKSVIVDVPVATEAVSSNEVAIAEVPVAAPALMIEGDATVADYDATTGLVETHEGRNFSIGSSVGASGSWDDYSGHVHYRCDGGGNCTLSRAGVVVPHARMTT